MCIRDRVQRIADLMADLFAYDDKFHAVTETSVLVAGIEKLNAIEITSEYGERMAEATDLKESIAAELAGKLEAARKRDAEAAELAELRKQKEDRERAEREKKIAEDAAAKALEKSRKAKADAEAAEAERLADEKHVEFVLSKAVDDLLGKSGISLDDAKFIVSLIKDGEISSVSINF